MKHVLVSLAALIVVGAFLLAVPAIPQDPAYHVMADQRTLLGIPNTLNVLSNLPFAIVGALGLLVTFGARSRAAWIDEWERWPAAVLFTGIGLTAFGSGYYHLAPDNHRLVWDRLPMTLGFMGLISMVLAERSSLRAARLLFVPLMAAGMGSVVYWIRTEMLGAGDLRPYGLVQFGSLAAVVVLLIFGRPAPGTAYLVAGLAAYAGAKVLELLDREIFMLGGIVSGHTLKHLAAAGGVAFLVAMLRARTPSSAGRTRPS